MVVVKIIFEQIKIYSKVCEMKAVIVFKKIKNN
jgi:hypothetical protein